MLRHIDRLLIVALVLTGLGQMYLLAKSSGGGFASPPGFAALPGSPLPVVMPMLSGMPISGEIAGIEGHTLSLKNIAGPGAKDELRFIVNDATEVVEQIPIDLKELQAKMAAFQKEMQKGLGPDKLPKPPQPFEERKLSLSALKSGDRVTVTPDKAGDADHPTAARIVRQPGPPAQPPVPAAPSQS